MMKIFHGYDAKGHTRRKSFTPKDLGCDRLNYRRGLKVPLFRCKWVNKTRGGVKEDPQYGMTIVDLNNLAYADEPFVLANDVA